MSPLTVLQLADSIEGFDEMYTDLEKTNYEIIEGDRKNSQLYVYKSYLYTFHHVSKKHLTVRCREWKRKSCRARGTIGKENNIFVEKGEHTHPINEHEFALLTMKTSLKRKAESSTDTLREIFEDVRLETPIDVATQITFSEIESTMFKRRKSKEPPAPDSAENSVHLLNENRTLCSNYHKGVITENGCALIFSGEEQDYLLNATENQTILIDIRETFSPQFFDHVVCIHLVQNVHSASRTYPIAIGVLSITDAHFYLDFFTVIKEQFPSLNPTTLIVDFDPPIRDALHNVYDTATIIGCWYHYKREVSEIIRKYFSSYELNSPVLKNWLLSILSIPLLPRSRISDGFDLLLHAELSSPNIHLFKEYMETTWRYSTPLEELSVNYTLERINDVAELFNRQFKKFAAKNNKPNLFNFLRRVSQVLDKAYTVHCSMSDQSAADVGTKKAELKLKQHLYKAWDSLENDNDLNLFFSEVKFLNVVDLENFKVVVEKVKEEPFSPEKGKNVHVDENVGKKELDVEEETPVVVQEEVQNVKEDSPSMCSKDKEKANVTILCSSCMKEIHETEERWALVRWD